MSQRFKKRSTLIGNAEPERLKRIAGTPTGLREMRTLAESIQNQGQLDRILAQLKPHMREAGLAAIRPYLRFTPRGFGAFEESVQPGQVDTELQSAE